MSLWLLQGKMGGETEFGMDMYTVVYLKWI